MIDTHCHLNDVEAFPDPAAAIESARLACVDRLIVVGINDVWSKRAIELAETSEGVFAVVGFHPNQAAEYQDTSLAQIEAWLQHPKVVALGEVGLDYHWNFATRDQQYRALTEQLDLAEQLGVPVVLHCREAYEDLLELLESRGSSRLLFHCFAGDEAQLNRALALGAYIGVDGPVTYKKADELRRIIALVPTDRLLIETDAPWLSPEPFRGKPNTPANLPLILQKVAEVKSWTLKEAETITTANAERFFGLPARV